jgi:hypothetical protein
MTNHSDSVAVNEAVSTLADDELTKAARGLMIMALRDATDTFKHGTPDLKAPLTKLFLTAIAKEFGERGTQEDKASLREEFQRRFALPDVD